MSTLQATGSMTLAAMTANMEVNMLALPRECHVCASHMSPSGWNNLKSSLISRTPLFTLYERSLYSGDQQGFT